MAGPHSESFGPEAPSSQAETDGIRPANRVPIPGIGELSRSLGVYPSVAIVVGTTIGTGIFLKPSEIARLAGSTGWAMAAWVIGGLLSLLGALVYMELGTAMPAAGADCEYLKRGLGPAWGFLYGWKNAVVQGPASTSALAAGVVLFGSYFWPNLKVAVLKIATFQITAGQFLGMAIILILGAVNSMAVQRVGRIQIVLSALKVLTLVTVIVTVLVHFGSGTDTFPPQIPVATPSIPVSATGILAAVATSLWAYSGWHTLLRVGSEVADPGRTIPKAILGGFTITLVLFLLINAACFAVLGFGGVVRSTYVVSDMLARVSPGGVRGLSGWLTIAMIISALGSMNATMLGAARIPYAMARDGLLPRWLATVSESTRAPVASVVYTSVFASILVLTGSFEDLTSLFVFTQWMFFALGTLALFRLRKLEPGLSRPARVPGYPFFPGLFLLLATGLMIGTFLQRPLRSGLGLALVLAGLPVYFFWQRGFGAPGAPQEPCITPPIE